MKRIKTQISKKLLGHIYNFALSVGYELHNVDISIMAQTPKIAPYKSQMRECIAKILHLPKSRVNIKATTTEISRLCRAKRGRVRSGKCEYGLCPLARHSKWRILSTIIQRERMTRTYLKRERK